VSFGKFIDIGGFMILAQFQSLYPEGSLTAELVQIDRGQYIVRATVQVNGVIRSTGMAAANTVEEAEDQARERALMVLPMPKTSSESESIPVKQVTYVAVSDSPKIREKIAPEPVVEEGKNNSFLTPALNLATEIDDSSPVIAATPSVNVELPLPIPAPLEIVRDREPSSPISPMVESQIVESQPLPDLDISATNIKPFPQRGYSKSQESSGEQKTTGRKKKQSEPVDQSDNIARIGMEMQRLSWTMDQGRDHLIKTYNKRSRHLLSEEELKDFLQYLESQPTPTDILSDIDPLAGF
jgi:hypothetical protein